MCEPITVTAWMEGKKYCINGRAGESMLSVLSAVCPDFAGCGRGGTCGRCRLRFITAAPLPVNADRLFFTPQQLREGWRLACLVKLAQDCQVELHFEKQRRMNVVTKNLNQVKEARQEYGPWRGEEQDKTQRTFIAVDIGTTTVAMQLVNQADGSILDTYSFLNPQRIYGTDVVARIQADAEGHGPQMRQSLLQKMEEGITQFKMKPEYMVIAGNTTMEHILLGHRLKSLGREPFRPVDITEQNTLICNVPARILPGISAFVGADIIAGLYACGFARQEEICMLIDLGTNGELVIGNKNRLLATATAAGPAFEGGATAGIHGADMVSLAAGLLEQGKLDATGLLSEPYFTQGVAVGDTLIRRQDIRALQTAKAAVYAGIGILCDAFQVTCPEVSRVYLAGGFGYYLNPEEAFAIGLLPEQFRGKTTTAGNSALAGAVKYGCALAGTMGHGSSSTGDTAFRKQSEQGILQRLASHTQILNLAKQPGFEERYLNAMFYGAPETKE